MSRFFLLIFLASASIADAQPWIPNECSNRSHSGVNDLARSMAEAKPGSANYVPRPFPRTPDEVIEDFKYGFQHMWRGVPLASIPPDQARIYRGIEQSSLRFRVERVENWTRSRCSSRHPQEYMFLVYVHDMTSGEQIGRMSLAQSGLVATWIAKPPEGARDHERFLRSTLPPLSSAAAEVRKAYGIQGSRPQYVTTSGSLWCSDLDPCVALQSAGKVYLLHVDGLFEFGPSSRSHSLAEVNDPVRRNAIHRSLNPEQERLVSVGSERWVVARRVPPRAAN